MRLLVPALPALFLCALSATAVDAEHHADASSPSEPKPHSTGHIRAMPSSEAIRAELESKVQRIRNGFFHEHGRRASKQRGRRASRRGPTRHARTPRRASLAASGVDVEPKQFASPKDPKPSPVTPAADGFSGSHPLVGRALDSMEGELKLLRGRREATKAQGEQLKDSAQKAMDGLSAGSSIRRKLVGAKTAMHAQSEFIERLEDQEEHLKQEHDSVLGSLHKTMEPRIAARQRRLDTSEARLQKTEQEVQRWSVLSKERKANALQTLRERKLALDDLQAAEEAVKRATFAEAKAQKSYKESNKRVGQQVSALKLAETKLKASQSVEGTEQEQVSQEGTALDRTKGILQAEEGRLDKAFSSSRARLGRRIARAKAARQQAEQSFDQAKKSYAAWKASQKTQSRAVTKVKADFDDKQRAYEQKREEVLKMASDKAVAQATAESGWSDVDWAWSGGADGRDEDDTAGLLSIEDSD